MKPYKLFISVIFSVFVLVACKNNSGNNKPKKIVSDSSPVLDSVSTDILQDKPAATPSTINP